jgi:hypothetical protein
MALFTPQTNFASQPVYTAQDIQAQQRAEYTAALERQRAAQQRVQAQQDATAQQLVDYLSANPLQWSDQSFLYNPSDNNWYKDETGAYDLTNWLANGSVQGGSYVPTLDEAKTLLSTSSGYTGLGQNKVGETPQEQIKRVYGNNISDQLADALVSGAMSFGGGSTRNGDATFLGSGTDPLRDVYRAAGIKPSLWPSSTPSSPAPNAPSAWQPQADALNQQTQANSDLYTDAYNKITMGGNYGGGVINDAYSQPFSNVVGAQDASWAMSDNPLASMPWATSSWNTPSYGGPQSQQSASSFGTGATSNGGLGGLGGGPWGARNPWSPG